MVPLGRAAMSDSAVRGTLQDERIARPSGIYTTSGIRHVNCVACGSGVSLWTWLRSPGPETNLAPVTAADRFAEDSVRFRIMSRRSSPPFVQTQQFLIS